jgi:hypothetical protein
VPADDPDDPDEPIERFEISKTQVIASSAAAVTAAILCSLFGVTGTVIGTAIASMMASIGSALYVHSMRRTQLRLRRLHQAGAASPPLAEVVKTARQQGRRLIGQVPLRTVGVVAVAAFVFTIALVSAVELGVGKPLSALFGVPHSGNRTTTIGSFTHRGGHRSHHPKATPTPTPATTPSSPASHSPTPTPTPTVTVTVTPSTTPTLSTTPSSRPPTPSTTPSGGAG